MQALLVRRVAHLLKPPKPRLRRRPLRGQSIQTAICEVAAMLNRPGWSSYLVGGTLRDLLLAPAAGYRVQPRDVDIIVEGASREELRELLRETLTLERFTRFGGLHLTRSLPSGDSQVFDIWGLADNWGFSSKQIPPRIQDFPGTTFMNIDSCAVELWPPPGTNRAVYSLGFFEGIEGRVLDINYAPNPYPGVCAVRALMMAARLQFTMTHLLAGFILQHASTDLIDAQVSHYGMVRAGADELKSWIREIQSQYDRGQQRIAVRVSRARQRELWLDYPRGARTGA